MKLFKLKLLIVIFTFPLMSCIDEIVPAATETEIILEVSHLWNGDMTENGSPYGEFESTISADSGNESQIFISNFHNSGGVVTGIVYTDLTIDIPEQTIGSQTFSGTGDISNDYSNITWDYTVELSDETVVQVIGTYTYGGAV